MGDLPERDQGAEPLRRLFRLAQSTSTCITSLSPTDTVKLFRLEFRTYAFDSMTVPPSNHHAWENKLPITPFLERTQRFDVAKLEDLWSAINRKKEEKEEEKEKKKKKEKKRKIFVT
jgi:hypothetical protein